MSEPTFARPELGEMSSIVCFKAVVTGTEKALGEKAAAIALIAAGRDRGKQLANQLELKNLSVAEAAVKIQSALGAQGTRLCAVDKIEEVGNVIKVYCRETICSAGEDQGSPRRLTYTLGAIQGALEEMLGKRLRGKQTESVLRGGTHDVIDFEPLIA